MRKIDKLIFVSVFPPFIITLTVLTFIVFIGKAGSWFNLFITNNAALDIIAITFLAIFPTIMIFSLPLSYLIGILIGMSGLNGESQITALRACGVPIRRLLTIILSLGVLVGIVTAFMTVIVVPRSNSYLRQIKDKILLTQAPAELQARVFNEDMPDRVFYLEDITADKKEWSGIFMATGTESKTPDITLASKGTWVSVDDSSTRRFQLHLENGAKYSINFEKPGDDQRTEFKAIDVPIELQKNSENAVSVQQGQERKISEMSMAQLWKRSKDPASNENVKALVEINQRLALPFSIFPFSILGLSLAVRSTKGGRTLGFALSLVVVVLFYILFINGIRLAKIGEVDPFLGPWAANIFLGCFGVFLLLRSDRSTGTFSWISSSHLKQAWEKITRHYSLPVFSSKTARSNKKSKASFQSVFRFLFPKTFDLYISKGFLTNFFWALITCSLLFMLFTLFELLDDVIRNGTPLILVLEYFTFLVPQILMMAIPMSVLLGVLINFGILEKNSEITAIKAGGWSLYRVTIPIFLIAGILSLCLFLIQDYVLPTSNERQDKIWSSIKNRPPRTSLMKRKWILGEDGRIYNYEHFDETQDSFVGLNIFETDLDSASILSIVRASRANIDASGAWNLKDGWIRDYRAQKNGFKSFKTETMYFPEKADYFKREIFQPTESSKMTYHELMSHINYLMKSGYNAIELQVELMKKISFPFSCLVMALLAIPFSFVVGNRGAFFGIGASIAIAIIYLMISGLFESMGSYGILAPFLAAWAPNIVFGAAGCWLLLSIRT